MPNCTEEIQTSKIEFGRLGRRVIEGCFDGGSMTSDAGVMLLGATDRKLGLLDAAARCITDPRNPLLITHSVADMLRQRVYGLALGWEDLNDHGALRCDVAMQTAVGVDREVASAPTLCRLDRLEKWADPSTAWRLHEVLVGKAESQPKGLSVPITLPPVAPADVNTWVQQSEALHPSIRQARGNLDIAELEVRKAEAGHKPTLDAVASYNITRNPSGSATIALGGRANTANLGLQLNVPLFAGFSTQNRIRETLSLRDKAGSDLEGARRTVSQGTRTAFFGVESGQGQVRALEAAELSSQSALDANKLGYQVGVRINIDVLNAQSQLFQTKRDLAQARYNVLLGGLRLRQANGSLSPADLQPMNSLLAK